MVACSTFTPVDTAFDISPSTSPRSGAVLASFAPMILRFPMLLAGLVLLLFACTPPPAAPLTLAEEGLAIAEVFETAEPYSARTLDSLDLVAFFARYPEHLVDSAAIVDFYARRNMQLAWVVRDSLSASADAFINLVSMTDTTLPQASSLRRHLQKLYEQGFVDGQRTALCDSCSTDLELRLTAQFFRFAEQKYGGYLSRDLKELNWFIPRGKKDPTRLLDSLANGSTDLSAYEPIHPQYQLLKERIQRYHELANEPWPALALPEGRKKLEPGDSAEVLGAIRHRLHLIGDLAEDGTGQSFDSTLVEGVKRFQIRHGLHPDAVLGQGFFKAINVPMSERLRTMLVNMERLRWVPEKQASNLLLVNIPEFRLHIYEEDTIAWSMDVVVGNTVTRTVIFSDSLSQIVFSPTWTVPMSITRGEILPALKKDPNYLKKKNMEIIGGSETNPIIRQKPGASNALGRVKFLFPNSYSIYFHDTPSKSFFARESRAFSHGCIRLSKPQEFAEYLLRNDTTWTSDKIKKAMFSGRETYVKLKEKRPVSITYFTAWVDREGRLNFRDDVYRHDARLASELFYEEQPVSAELR
jgi:L,D-transpeptidase YcbB